MFIYCKPIFFKIVKFGHLENTDEHIWFLECYRLHDGTGMGHVWYPHFTDLGPTLLISHKSVFQLRLSHGVNFWHFQFTCQNSGLGQKFIIYDKAVHIYLLKDSKKPNNHMPVEMVSFVQFSLYLWISLVFITKYFHLFHRPQQLSLNYFLKEVKALQMIFKFLNEN